MLLDVLLENEVYLSSREVQIYLQPYTGRVVDKWLNPWTGEILPVMHVANSPVQVRFGEGLQLQSKTTSTNRQTIVSSVTLSYPNPLADDPIYKPYDPKKLYQASELFQFHYDVDNKKNAGISWSRVSGFLPWMKMGAKSGNLIFHAAGRRLSDYNNLHPTLRKIISERAPLFRNAPTCPLKIRMKLVGHILKSISKPTSIKIPYFRLI